MSEVTTPGEIQTVSAFESAFTVAETDPYKLHKTIWSLFQGIPERSYIYSAMVTSGVSIVTLRTEDPVVADQIKGHWVDYMISAGKTYDFSIRVNLVHREHGKVRSVPTGKELGVMFSRFTQKGFKVEYIKHADTQPLRFKKGRRTITLNDGFIQGRLTITDPESFAKTLLHGIGRGKGFGFGMIQLKEDR